jgi:PAS domain S-box-containing protein
MNSPPRSRKLILVLALSLAALVVTAGGIGSYRKIESFQPLGFEARLESGYWLVTATEPELATVRPGDQILLVNGQGPGRGVDLRTMLRGRPESELVVLRDGELRTLKQPLPPLRIEYPYLILALIGCGYLVIGFYTLLRDQKRPALLFFVWCLTSAAVYLITVNPPYDWLDKGSYLLEELARILLAPLTVHLFSIFPRPLGRTPRIRRALSFVYLPAVFLILLQIDLVFFGGAWLFGGALTSALPVLDRLELFHLVIFSLAAAAILAWRLTRTREPEAQRQAAWIAVGMGAGYLPFFAFYVLPQSLGVEWPTLPTALAVLPLALVPLTFSYAVLRYKLWDIGVVVRDTLSLSLTILVGVSGFALANLLVNRLVPDEMALGRNFLVFVTGLTIAGLMVPTRRSVNRSLERLQYRGTWNRRRALAEFGSEILKERDLDRLCHRVGEELETCLDVAPTNLLLIRGEMLVPERPEPGLPHFLSTARLIEPFWSNAVTPLSAVGLPDEDLSEQKLYAAGYRYAFPLSVREDRLGVFVTGYKSDGVPLSSDDLDLIRNLLNQMALAIENARLLDQVRVQLDEVTRLQQFSQGIIDSSPAGIAVLDGEKRIVSANGTFSALVEHDLDQLPGKQLREILSVDPLPSPADGIREISIRDRRQQERHLQISTAPLHGGTDERNCVLLVQDVSERVAMEEALREKDRLASLGVLAAGVAHEVNTPITGISSYAQMLLADTPAEDPHYEILKKVEKQTFRAARIVNNLLNFARRSEGGKQLLDLAPLIDDCLDLLRERMAKLKVNLIWQLPEGPIEVIGNDGELQQVFTNLILNALDAMQTEGDQLRVDIEGDDQWVRVAIEDNGPGIPTDEVESVFQPFYSTKLSQGGTGLGLSISHDIVRRHGGDIQVISHPGRGSRFTVELPRRTESMASDTQ